mgnify:CR=1 FL=1
MLQQVQQHHLGCRWATTTMLQQVQQHHFELPVGQQQQQCCSRCNNILRGNPGQRGPGGGGLSECQSLKQNDHPESTQEQQVPQHVWQENNGRFASFPTDRIWTISYGAPCMMTNIFGASGTTGAAGGALGAPRLHVGCIRHDGCHRRHDGCHRRHDGCRRRRVGCPQIVRWVHQARWVPQEARWVYREAH